jgi:putative FmdB family regulatory protein
MMLPMPIYEYACTSCGERTEAKQAFSDPPLEECPVCGGRLRKLYSPVGIVFKGSGFYSTDARKPAPSKSSDGDKKPAKKDKSKQDGGKQDKTTSATGSKDK